MEEKKLFDHSGITVTSARLIAPKQTFAITGITSVKVEKTNPVLLLAVASILGGLIILAAGKLNVWAVAAPVLIGILLLFVKPRYHVVVDSGSGEIKALNSTDKDFIESVVKAVNQAIITRS